MLSIRTLCVFAVAVYLASCLLVVEGAIRHRAQKSDGTTVNGVKQRVMDTAAAAMKGDVKQSQSLWDEHFWVWVALIVAACIVVPCVLCCCLQEMVKKMLCCCCR